MVSVVEWETRAVHVLLGSMHKRFPNKYSNRTSNDSDGYPVYRRREDGNFVEKNHVRLDNRFVVPYNSYLLKKYQAHINVEWCNQVGSIKYLFKYINKGPDRVTALIQVGDHDNEAPSNDEVVDEIKEFYDCRYLSACESSWRILKYEVVYRTHAVERLPFHLPGQQHVVYDEDADIDDVISKPSVASTKFIQWMECNKTNLAALLNKTKLIIWDEAPMMNKHCFEALDRTLRDILRGSNTNSLNIPFGGKVIVFGRDFRQILLVIIGGTRQDIMHASLNSSYLWDHIHVLRLTKNMRLRAGAGSSNTDDIKEFADWILKVGDGRLGGPNDGEAMIDIPNDILIKDCADPVAPTHEVVEFINDHLAFLDYNSCVKEKVLLSSDSYVNLRLVLKVGAPVMLLRNIDQSEGLCNGTRLRIKELGDRAIKAEILTGTKVGETVSLTRFKLTPSDKRLPLQIK
ncbi:ATP-dependent DNA helicase PIF1-like protein [Tanacetum coccineum]|uniref:ATP-dependent DNA helicase n=1 Tax=Tanacetum coccineum TaxID=301880 RepID=A0ABQ4Z6U8_9ASTR